ncbi:unnamed protein product [Rotaria magnacalcarata]|uniref:G domain-containing protein n=1 Tax=Rotaria magnacalcarata TaxID=392030 RepID=A0A816NX49_9BILA|nr:unnamed protein product [Rotaria magnacalcarata]
MDNTNSIEDLIIDRAELTCNVELVHHGSVRKIFEVSAYPTSTTRKLTNNLSGTTNNLTQIAVQCQWVTPGILQFFICPSTQTIVEARPKLGYIVVYLQTLLSDQHKCQLAEQAKKQYWNLPVSTKNFSIFSFRTFLAELHISVHGTKRKFFGTLEGSKQVHPFHVHFEIDDEEDLADVTAQLQNPNENEFMFRYYYTLSGSSTSCASVTITADQVTQCQLENELFGDSQIDSMIVSRNYMDQIAAKTLTRLNICETIGIGAAPLNCDLVKQAIIDSITSGFKKYSIEELREHLNAGMKCISDDLKANIVSSYQENQDDDDHHRRETAYDRTTSDINETKAQKIRNKHEINKSAQSGQGSASGSGWGASVNLSGQGQNDSTTDSSTSKDVRNDVKTEEQRSNSNKAIIDTKRSHTESTTVAGTKVNAKTIDAAIIERSKVRKGFDVILDRWVHQMASTYVSGYLNKDDIPPVTDEQNTETNELKPRGNFHGILKSNSTNDIVDSLRAAGTLGVFNILITGRSGVGKSTLINLFHNFFLNLPVDELQRIVDPKTERLGQSMSSSTSACVRYLYRSNDGYLYQIIDLPGLADTSGEEENEKNIQLIISAAEYAEHINCVLFVCNGTGDTRLGLDIRTTFILLKNNLPTAVLDNVMAFFTFTTDMSASKCDLREVLRLQDGRSLVDVDRMPKYGADSSFFDAIDPSLSVKSQKINRRRQEDNYDLACEQIAMLLAQVRQTRPIASDAFSAVIESRNRIMANIARIRVQLNIITELAEKLDAAKKNSSKLDSQAKANKNWKKNQVIQMPEQIVVSYKNTLCSIHSCNCHIKCQLRYIEGMGSTEFKRCAAFGSQDICSNKVCAESRNNTKCTFEHHYHDYKEWRTTEKTVEVVYDDMQQLYHLSVAKKQMLDVEIDHNKRRIEFIKHAFEMALIELLEECRDMVQKVKGFNLIAYIDVVLEALNKNIKDIQDVERRSELKGKVEFFMTLLNNLQNPQSSNRLTHSRR